MKLKCEIGPLDSKYYGTVIQLINVDTGTVATFEVWVNGIGSYDPSEREYDIKGNDGKFYIRDRLPNGGYTLEEYEICNDHYETQAAYEICNVIVEALNGLEIK